MVNIQNYQFLGNSLESVSETVFLERQRANNKWADDHIEGWKKKGLTNREHGNCRIEYMRSRKCFFIGVSCFYEDLVAFREDRNT